MTCRLHRRLAAALVPLASMILAASSGSAMTIQERVEAQRILDRITYSHQIGATRPFEAAVPVSATRAKVARDLRQETVLEEDWGVPITRSMLEQELGRILRETRMPDRLQAILSGLGDDPDRILEALVRPIVVRRELRRLLEREPVSHGPVPDEPEPAAGSAGGTAPLAERREPAVRSGAPGSGGLDASLSLDAEPAARGCQDTWLPGACTPDRSDLYSMVWTGSHVITWGGPDLSRNGSRNTGFLYDPVTDSWSPTTTAGAPDSRVAHTAVWTGEEMIVWGGEDRYNRTLPYNTGGRYNPVTDSWIPTSTTGAPDGRFEATAVWTGDEMIIWGGYDSSFTIVDTGGRYDPLTDTWQPMSAYPGNRALYTAVWTGTEMILWGGPRSFGLGEGIRYRPATDSWHPMADLGRAEFHEEGHSAVWTGDEMIVWGGCCAPPPATLEDELLRSGAGYDPVADAWRPLSEAGAPSARQDHGAVWTGSEMLIFGGAGRDCQSPTGPCSPALAETAGLYDPAGDSWRPAPSQGAPRGNFDPSIAMPVVLAGDYAVIQGCGSHGGIYVVNGPPNADDDGDGYGVCGGDCNDGDPAINPAAAESCDMADNDCDGLTDEAALHVQVRRTRAAARSGGRAEVGPPDWALVKIYDGSPDACAAVECGLPSSHDWECPVYSCGSVRTEEADQGKVSFELPEGDYLVAVLLYDQEWRYAGGPAPHLGCASERRAVIHVTQVGDELRPRLRPGSRRGP